MKTLTAFLSVALLLGAGCGDPSPERKIEAATEQVERVEQEILAAEEALERETEELAQAQEELSEARETLREAESRLVEAKQKLAEVADDAYLFRTIQGALLADDSLEGQAVAARVHDGVVTLEGQVTNQAEKKRAGELANAVPGVERVDNKVRVELAGP